MEKYIGITLLASVGLLILFKCLSLIMKTPNLTSEKFWMIRLIASLGAACLGSAIPGALNLKINGAGEIYLTAGGAAVFFLVSYLMNPPTIVRDKLKISDEVEKHILNKIKNI